MNDDIKAAIKLLASRINGTTKADDAMKFTQSALNLAHVLATLDILKKN